MFTALISALALGQSLLVAHLLARRISHSNVYLPLAMFFVFNAVAQACFIIREPSVVGTSIAFLPELTLFKLIVELVLPALPTWSCAGFALPYCDYFWAYHSN